MDKKALIALAQGSEEMELVIVADLLRRAGISVKLAGETEIVTCSRGVKILPDLVLNQVDDDILYDVVIIPGGAEGTNRLTQNEYLIRILSKHIENNCLIAAICAAPLVLADNKFLNPSAKITSHPSVKEHLLKYHYIEEAVVVDDNFITSRGAGTAIDFSLEIIRQLAGEEISAQVATQIVY